MRTVSVRGLELGSGRPKICIPVTGKNHDDILRQGQMIAQQKGICADLCEWRIDAFKWVSDDEALKETGIALRQLLSGMPLLVTFRSKQEGGSVFCDQERYSMLIEDICKGRYADLLDIELFTAGEDVKRLLHMAEESGAKTVLSSHDFVKTPRPEKNFLHVFEKARKAFSSCGVFRL